MRKNCNGHVMKIILTEIQLERLRDKTEIISEGVPLWLRRRTGKENLKVFIDRSLENQETKCDDFGDEFEFADNILSWACDDFLTQKEEFFLDDNYDEIYSMVYDYMKDLFGLELLIMFRDQCESSDIQN